MKQMLDVTGELAGVSRRVGEILAADSFPETLQPEMLREAVRDYPARGGKRLRPALLLWSCGLLDGDPGRAEFAAAAVEVYHNWTLVHDDIIDRDDTRRGRPTCHCAVAAAARARLFLDPADAARHGQDVAILAGDVQQAWANHLLLRSTETGASPELALALLRRLQDDVNRDLISGEALDVEFCHRDWDTLSPAEVEAMLYLKTGALLRYCAETGARLALDDANFADDPRTSRLGDFAAAAGVAFQLRDDWLGLYGDAATLGKPVGSDLAEAKPTLLLLHAWARLDATGRTDLRRRVGRPEVTQEDLAAVRGLVRECGAEKVVLERAAALSAQARAILHAFSDNAFRERLIAWTDYLLGRNS
jgi:geranylgeranyl diphosphate synthase type I